MSLVHGNRTYNKTFSINFPVCSVEPEDLTHMPISCPGLSEAREHEIADLQYTRSKNNYNQKSTSNSHALFLNDRAYRVFGSQHIASYNQQIGHRIVQLSSGRSTPAGHIFNYHTMLLIVITTCLHLLQSKWWDLTEKKRDIPDVTGDTYREWH